MLTQLFTIGLLMLFAVMLPGPDFAIVTKNTVVHGKRAGLFTTLGISSALLVHITYCILGLAVIISQSILLFNIIKYLGAFYLIYLGIQSLLAKSSKIDPLHASERKTKMSNAKAFQQGFLCNLLNPKATLFFLALFTVIIKPETPLLWNLAFALEMFLIVAAWFSCLTLLLSHPRIIQLLEKAEKIISKMLGVFLIGFGVALAFTKK